jgi:hypothetical protein
MASLSSSRGCFRHLELAEFSHSGKRKETRQPDWGYT